MTAEECLSQLNDKLMEVYGVNTSRHGLLWAVKLVATCDTNICSKSWFGGAVRKVT